MNRIIEWLLGYEPGKMVGEGTSWRLDFIADYNNYVKFALILVLAALAYLVIRSYRREGDTPRGAKTVLAVLRLAVLVLIFAILLRPAVVVRFTRTLYSSIVVLIDDSKSMSFTDRYADEKLGDMPRKLSAYLGVNETGLTNLSRKDILIKAMDRPDGALDKLARDHPLVFLRYSTTQPGKEQYTRPFGLVDRVQAENPSSAGKSAGKTPASNPVSWGQVLKDLSAAGFETNAAAGIFDSLERVKGQQGQRVAAIVHLGDGQMTVLNAASRLSDAMNYAARSGAAVCSVLVGDPTPPKDLAVTALDAPPEVRSGATVEFTATLAHRNLENQQVTIRLLRRRTGEDQWTPTSVIQTVQLVAAGESEEAGRSKGLQKVAMQLELSDKETGVFRFRAVVDPRPDEQNAANNSADATVRISEKKVRILVISGDAGKEFLFLKNFLFRQPELYQVSVWQQNLDSDISQAGTEGMKIKSLPRTNKELLGDQDNPKDYPGYDVVVLYDPEPSLGGFDKVFVKLLYDFVARGGGLCFIAGNKYSETTVLKTEGHEMLSDLLPVILTPNTLDITERIGERTPQPWPVHLTSYGGEHPMMRLGETDKDTEGIWSILPGIFWSHSVGKVKPGARVLAVNSNPMRRTDRNEREPLVASLMIGKGGRAVYVGSDETWRWRSLRDARYYERFWSNIVRYLATLQARNVVITAGGDNFSVGERITIEVEAYDEKNDYQPVTSDTFTVDMVNARDPQDVQAIVLQRVEGKPGYYKGTITALHQGSFHLTALRNDPKADEKVAAKDITIAPPEAEAARTEADAKTMESIASRPENFLQIQDVDRLANLIPPGRLTAVNDVPRELWDSRLSLALIVVLLAIEWILRKKYNMA